ncbi:MULTISPECIES: hypothetical protein [unclassified Clostridioides]|uniref:hypothetical protein n=1 Tax=unclassified Clostridioides TaxID=2635829 RepID=UPI001D125EA8|nr:hypothetical protein [Clostridioides sp. ES-S-0049-03]MCC0675351.1 hypothetical protein [Clostridioides sp. ES-W-0018-02]MCC0709840.1 hypothetical protein [Clostridioides sp. ES-W-0017-02]UDN59822.1 hypothetical protein JJC01_08165 [Clostridioides sp. ES-S-0010-02]
MTNLNFDTINKKEVNKRDYSTYKEEFYGSSDVLIYINGKHNKQISAIKFYVKEQSKPIYGYTSRVFDDIAVGNRIVLGYIKVPVSNALSDTSNCLEQNISICDDFILNKEEKIYIPDWIYGYDLRNLNDNYICKYDDNFLYKNKCNLDDNNVSFLYDKSLFYVDFGSKYDIRVHSVQTALVYMGYMYKELSFSELKYGHYCVCTFDMVKAFQKESGIIPTGRLCKKTWNLIFKKLYSNYNIIILKNNEKEICIKDMQEENQYKSDCNLKAINSFVYDELECDYNLIDNLIDDYNYKENKLKYDLENSDYQPFFNPNNINTLRKNNFSISLIYGDKKEKYRKIIGVSPVSVSQEIDTTGNPIYDIYEFIAKDVIETNN